ncbi:MAG: hypothetical protein RL235_130 [Chlamydiota bacterium]|jgi:hypothetical protein
MDCKAVLHRLLSRPIKKNIGIEVDVQTGQVTLSMPVFSNQASLPEAVVQYVEARHGHVFRPHRTTFHLNEDNQVILQQKLDRKDPSMRAAVLAFWQLAQYCHRLLMGVAQDSVRPCIQD